MARINDLVKAYERGEDITNWKCYGPQEMRMKQFLLDEEKFVSVSTNEETPFNLSGEYDGSSIEVNANGEIDVKALLEEGKLPLKIKVNVTSGGN